jgi:hypothetical protein
MAELLLGRPRTRRDRSMTDSDPGKAFPGGEIYLSMPGLGDRLAARIAGEIGDHIHHYETPNALHCDAGSAPVTRRSGKSDFVVARRLAHNHYLGDAMHQWAFCSLTQSAWAREFYDEKITAGKSHHAGLRALSNRWLEILWHCLAKGVHDDRQPTKPTATTPSDTLRRQGLTEGVSPGGATRRLRGAARIFAFFDWALRASSPSQART